MRVTAHFDMTAEEFVAFQDWLAEKRAAVEREKTRRKVIAQIHEAEYELRKKYGHPFTHVRRP